MPFELSIHLFHVEISTLLKYLNELPAEVLLAALWYLLHFDTVASYSAHAAILLFFLKRVIFDTFDLNQWAVGQQPLFLIWISWLLADVAANVVHVAKFDVDLDKHGYSGILQILQGKLGDQLLLDRCGVEAFGVQLFIQKIFEDVDINFLHRCASIDAQIVQAVVSVDLSF